MKDELEQLLATLEPRSPSSRLTEAVRYRLENQLAPARSPLILRRLAAPILLAAAACLALLISSSFLDRPQPESAPSETLALQPRRATEEIVAMAEEVVYTGENREPMRSVHYQGIRTVEFRNQQTGSTWTVSYPWQETAIIPIHSL